MPRRAQEALRALTNEERQTLKRVARSRSEAAEVVGRARSLLAVADGAGFAAGARAGGRRSGYGVGKLVHRFNRDGVQALQTAPGAGRPLTYTEDLQKRIVERFRIQPDRARDGTGTWSLTTLQRALQREPGLERIGRDTIGKVLHAAGLTWQRDRTWCETGVAVRKTKTGKRVVIDPDAEAKKT